MQVFYCDLERFDLVVGNRRDSSRNDILPIPEPNETPMSVDDYNRCKDYFEGSLLAISWVRSQTTEGAAVQICPGFLDEVGASGTLMLTELNFTNMQLEKYPSSHPRTLSDWMKSFLSLKTAFKDFCRTIRNASKKRVVDTSILLDFTLVHEVKYTNNHDSVQRLTLP